MSNIMNKFVLILLMAFFAVSAPNARAAEFINLPVPFTPEAPDGLMVKPWNNACEEATLVMLDEYYAGKTNDVIAKPVAKKLILNYINIENKIFGYNGNTDAKEMVKLANEYSKYFEARVVTNPTITQIKDELKAKRPVAALVYGFKLQNPRILFSRSGSYYHTFVIKGFDEKTKEFIVNDNGDLKKGLDLRYSYDTIMDALADYSHKTLKTTDTPTVLFTSQRMLVKTKDSGRIYLIKDNQKHHISSPSVFKKRGWKWGFVMTVSNVWLDKLQSDPAI